MTCSCGVEVAEHPASRCLDACVAERVMGWVCPPDYNYWMTIHSGGTFDLHELKASWLPSSSIKSAWSVLDRWQGDYILRHRNDIFSCELFRPSEQWDGRWADTMPLAICRATLLAVESEPLCRVAPMK